MEKEEFFKKTIEETEDTLKITISCVPRKSAFEVKRVFNENIESFIPKSLLEKIILISKPSDKISNLIMPNHSSEGVWVYKIKKMQKVTKKRATRSRRSSGIKK